MQKPRSSGNSCSNSFGIYRLGIKTVIALILFIGLLYVVEQHIGWLLVLSDWGQLNLTTIIGITILVFLSHLLRIVRVHFAYNLTQKLAFIDVSAVSLLHNTLSFLLPMRIGEAALPLLSRKQLNMDIRFSTSTLFLIRLFDLHVLLMLLLSFTSNLWLGEHALWITLCCLLALPLSVSILKYLASTLTFLALAKPLLESHVIWIKVYLFTLTIWGVKLSALAFLAQQLGNLTLDHAWIATIMADGSALSPITGFANAGTFEAAFSLPLLPLGYSVNELLRIAVNVHIFVFVTNILSGMLGLILLRQTKTINA